MCDKDLVFPCIVLWILNYTICLFFPETLKQIIAKCIPGAKIQELCEFGDKLLSEETGKVFKKEKDLKKGEDEFERVCLMAHQHYCLLLLRVGVILSLVYCNVVSYSSDSYSSLMICRHCISDMHICQQLHLSLFTSQN